ncbi:MAG: hypothetical protein ABSH00_10330 [Bryobacteraceae bacterium]|jgi:hypothetical protein
MRKATLFNVVAAGVAGFIGGILAASAPARGASPEVMRASRFELVDPAGRAVARWEVDPETNSAHLRFIARGGVALDEGSFSDAGPFFSMNGRDGKRRISMSLDAEGKPALSMSDEHGLGRIVMGRAVTDTPGIPDTLDQWGLEFRPFGTTRPIAVIGMTNLRGRETKGVLVVNGEQVR